MFKQLGLYKKLTGCYCVCQLSVLAIFCEVLSEGYCTNHPELSLQISCA